jgi:hypothetical protein
MDMIYSEFICDSFFRWIEYKDIKVLVNEEIQFFNATRLCSSFGKNFTNWTTMSQTPTLISSFIHNEDIQADGKKHWSRVIAGNKNNGLLNGSYIHIRFLPALMLWLSTKLYLASVQMVEEWARVPIKKVNESLAGQIIKLSREVTELQQQQQLPNSKKLHKSGTHTSLKLIKKNDENAAFPYTILCMQKRNMAKSLKRLKTKYPNCNVVLDVSHCRPELVMNKKQRKGKMFDDDDDRVMCKRNELKSRFEDESALIKYINEHSVISNIIV